MADENIDSGMTVGLEEEIMADLSADLAQTDPNFSQALLLPKVRNAMREIKRARRYPKYYTDEQIESDMFDYYSNIRNIALYDYNQIGAEGQKSIGENGTSRTFVDRKSLFSGICAIARVI